MGLTKLLHNSSSWDYVDEYRNFGELADVALVKIYFTRSFKNLWSCEIKLEILGELGKVTALDDVRPALKLLRDKNIRVIAVSKFIISHDQRNS